MSLFLSLAGCGALDPMVDQPKHPPYSASEFFPDGAAMRRPPAGTVPRERRFVDARLATGRAPDGAYLGEIPVAMTRERLRQGMRQFQVYCAACHGVLGDGQSPVAGNMSLRPPPSLLEHAHHPPGFFFDVISRGFGLMPSYAAQISVEDRWAVAGFLRALVLSQSARLEHAPPDVRERLREEAR